MQKLADGDLTFRLPAQFPPDYRQIKDDFNGAIARLQETIRSLVGSTREVASAASISAYFGVTEPAMFGINLRYKSPFICAMIGSACAALFITLNHAQATGIGVGGLPAVLSIEPAKMLVYLIGMLIAIVVPFVLTLFAARGIR